MFLFNQRSFVHFCPTMLLGLFLLILSSANSSAQPSWAGKKSNGHSHKAPGNPYKSNFGSAPSMYTPSMHHGYHKPQRNSQLFIAPFAYPQPNFGLGYPGGDWFGYSPEYNYGRASIFSNFDSPRIWDYGSLYTASNDNQTLSIADQAHYTMRPSSVEIQARPVPSEHHAYPTIHTKAIARSAQGRAEAAFRAGNYHLAADLARQVVTLDSDNGIAFLFASHTSFAVGDYERAAKDLQIAIELLPADQWDFVVKNYRHFYGQNDYVRQMERLNNFLTNRPVHVPARIVRGHHWGSLGHLDSAYEDFSIAISKRFNNESILKLIERYNPAGAIKPEANFIQQPAPWLNEPPSFMHSGVQTSEASNPSPSNDGLFEAPSFPPDQAPVVPAEVPTEVLPAPDENDTLEDLEDFQTPGGNK